MNLYIVIRWDYNQFPYHTYTVEHIYQNKTLAHDKRTELNLTNPDPMVKDSYGPLSGCKYEVWETETHD